MNDVAINDLGKFLAINFANERDRANYIIDHAHYFKITYITHRSNDESDKFSTLTDARAAANFASRMSPVSRGKRAAPLDIVAYMEDSKGNPFEALVEHIPLGRNKNGK